jgi:hypothetical protein
MKALMILTFLMVGLIIGIGLTPHISTYRQRAPPVMDDVVLVDINSILDVGFVLFDPAGRRVDYFVDVNGESGHYTCDG